MKLRETMLYRGDATHVPEYYIDKTDAAALFGPGLYLTSDPEVAHDYTAARGDERVFPVGYTEDKAISVGSLVQQYVEHVAASKFDEKGFEARWRSDHKIGNSWGMPENMHRTMKDDLRAAQAAARREAMPGALAQVRAEMPNLRVVKLTTRELVLVRADRSATLSGFDIPEEYLARVLHAERPLSDKDLRAMRKLWLASYPRDNGDLRDHRGQRVGFDAWVANYKARGTRRAWAEDGQPAIGGTGENPSLDDLRNGTHGGHQVYTDSGMEMARPNSIALIRTLMKLGYVGLEYDGGRRMGQYLRGGGGRAHRAFVFWDLAAMKGFRRDNQKLPMLKGVSARSLPRGLPPEKG